MAGQSARGTRLWNGNDRRVLDFTVPSNPRGPSPKVKAEIRKCLKYLDRHPDPDCTRLRRRISQQTGITENLLTCCAGFHGGIHVLLHSLAPSVVLVESGNRETHTAAVENSGFPVQILEDQVAGASVRVLSDIEPSPHSVVLLGNPTFPGSSFCDAASVRELAMQAERVGACVAVDESFVEFHPDRSLLSLVETCSNLVVFRSFGPFYGLSGIRIGFAAAGHGISPRLQAGGPRFGVNVLAQRAAFVAMGDKTFRRVTLEWSDEERTFLSREFSKMDCTLDSAAAMFMSFRHERAQALADHLARRGVLVIHDSPPAGAGRFTVCFGRHRDNARLVRESRHFLLRREDQASAPEANPSTGEDPQL